MYPEPSGCRSSPADLSSAVSSLLDADACAGTSAHVITLNAIKQIRICLFLKDFSLNLSGSYKLEENFITRVFAMFRSTSCHCWNLTEVARVSAFIYTCNSCRRERIFFRKLTRLSPAFQAAHCFTGSIGAIQRDALNRSVILALSPDL